MNNNFRLKKNAILETDNSKSLCCDALRNAISQLLGTELGDSKLKIFSICFPMLRKSKSVLFMFAMELNFWQKCDQFNLRSFSQTPDIYYLFKKYAPDIILHMVNCNRVFSFGIKSKNQYRRKYWIRRRILQLSMTAR